MIQGENLYQADVIIVGGGLAGISTAYELLDKNQKVILLDRDEEENFGGLAKKSFGGVMFVDTPLQRRLGIKDSPELALSDWESFAEFGEQDELPKLWAKFYVANSVSLIYEWLTKKSVSFLPLVNWPERGIFKPGNSIPRWHIAWGTGYGIIEGILKHLEKHPNRKNLQIYYNHKVEELIYSNQTITGCTGKIEITGEDFKATAANVVIASGGICGGDLSLVKKNWCKEWGSPPTTLLNGSHKYADGLLHKASEKIGANQTHLDKQWHYAAGINHPNAKTENEGLSLVPPRSALWLDATGKRFGPLPLVGYTDTRYLVEQICKSPAQYSWQVMNWKIAIKELAVSGSDYMTAFRYKKKLKLLHDVIFGNKELVNRLIKDSKDIVVANSIEELAKKMNHLSLNGFLIDQHQMEKDIQMYDDQINRGIHYFNDDQLRRIANFRTYRGDKIRTCKFQKINDKKAYPLIAIREFILSRKSLGGIQTNLKSQVLNKKGEVISGLYAVGETAGFGGGGIHGKGSLEGTFLGSCILTGRVAAQSIVGKSNL
ncbi:MAG: FAD-binding dehydrogenase [Leptospiraceae bacterium]|nr:FAD-binding dehydrogenase [Leptospiraceae bacterium]MCP5495714.1 FAD-binding dehydrogenase [Leptospiraceae bacterium]